ncbi:MAG TPA: alpha/beta hydrolase [Polyangiaceae bacterium]|nr:alpha/beta hydrolase [Polyangiaceae bacterium]
MAISLDEWEREGRGYRHRGHRIFYRDEGSGPPLLLIHGFPTASWDWHKVWPALAGRFRVIAPDLIGYGFSAKPRPYDYRVADQANLVEGLLAELGVRRAGVLAHDYGDTVAQELLARARERSPGVLDLEYACLLNGGLYPEMHRPRPAQKLLASPLGPLAARLLNERGFARSFRAIFGPKTRPPPDELASFWRLVEREGGALVSPLLIRYMEERRRHRARWVGALESPPCPVRLIDGPEDPVSGAHLAAHYRARVPGADVVLLPGIGHYPQTEAPDEVLRAFFEFVDRVARG